MRPVKQTVNYTMNFKQLDAGILPGSGCLILFDNVGDYRSCLLYTSKGRPSKVKHTKKRLRRLTNKTEVERLKEELAKKSQERCV